MAAASGTSMSFRSILVVSSLFLLAFAAFAPPASAGLPYNVCIEGNPPCYGAGLVCLDRYNQVIVCVPDPCATANCFNAAPPQPPAVQCTEGLESYGILATCSVGATTVGGPIGCRTCVVTAVTVTCTEGTLAVGCTSNVLA